jgi:hypothetical protein
MFSVIDGSRVIALKLSSKYNNEAIDQLFDNSLNHLRFLTLDAVDVLTIDSIIRRDGIFNHLESLFIWFDRGQYRDKVGATSAWIFKTCSLHLKSLKYLSIGQHYDDNNRHRTVIDPSLSHLMSSNVSWQHLYLTTVGTNQLGILLSRLPKLQTLTSVVLLNSSTFVCPTMSYLNRCTLQLIRSTFESIVDFLTVCPSLRQLSLSMISPHIDALDDQQWQNVIERYLPQLKQFKLDMRADSLALNVAERLCTTSFRNNSFWQERKTCATVVRKPSSTTELVLVHIIIQFSVGIK